MKKMTINEQLDLLFKFWKSESNPEEGFIKDGLMRLPNVSDEKLDEMWKSSSKRIAFLLKENNPNGDGKEDDSRNWLNINSNLLGETFFRRIANLFYGLSHSDKSYVYWGTEVENCLEKVRDFFYSNTFAFVECKKQLGGPKCDEKVFATYLDKYKWYLETELRILDPNIIVCMGSNQFDFVLKMYCGYEVIAVVDGHVYYIPSKRITVIYSGHPSFHANGFQADVKHYEGVMFWYAKFIESEYYNDQFYKKPE